MLIKQVKLLWIFDELGIPHEFKKQVFGEVLTIIGFNMDPNHLTVTIPAESQLDLFLAMHDFACPYYHEKLIKFQCIAGWLNWSLNVCPLLRSRLSEWYAKIKEKTHSNKHLWISITLHKELSWFLHHFENLDRTHIMDAKAWDADEVDTVLLIDICLTGMSFWCLL